MLLPPGALVNRAGLDQVSEHIQDAASKGAKVDTGGQAVNGDGFFFQPTVLFKVTPDIACRARGNIWTIGAYFRV
jgi:succinate-semialdehyde dehydrogenase / glutarate-semialdehyde dehydrogenase